ncbi:MAG: DUF1329 domain-containing protein [Gammaproteobacteria bacterium]|nr:MAG: DUF1329 domain-containing protein [Gammaproteobacteria bacterium]
MSTTRSSTVKKAIAFAGAFALAVGSTAVLAKTTPEEQANLALEGTKLTPAGAIRAGNKEGSIPAWKNEPIVVPTGFKTGTYHADPFPDDKVLFTITAQNYQEYADKLSEGQREMFKTYPDFTMNIYPTRRTAVFNPYIYDAALENAPKAEVVVTERGIVAFKDARKAWAFPVPHNGNEAWMNQATRPITPWLNSFETTMAVTSTGDYVVNVLNIQKREKWSDPDIAGLDYDPSKDSLLYYQTLLAPAKLAGQVVLARDPARFSDKFRSAWAYSPGQRRVKRAPQIVYDNPLTASDGLATTDQKWGFNGPNDRFDWKLVGRKEIYIPYNAYKLHNANATPDKVINADGRVDQKFARYELHRVWVIDSVLKEGTSHDYGRRTFYLDEDSWWIMLVDGYDRRNQIWRYWESHDVMYYDIGFMNAAAEFQYDMQAGRMIALMWDKKNPPDFSWRVEDNYFTPASVRRHGVR